jgi:hypothetical protein
MEAVRAQKLAITTTTSSSSSSTSPPVAVPALDPLDVIAVYKGLKLNVLPIPKWIDDRYQEIAKQNEVKSIIELSRADKIITSKYLTLHPMDNQAVFNTFIDGFRVDILFKDANLIIELDSPAHLFPARKRYDAERDGFLAKKRGYEVSYSKQIVFFFLFFFLFLFFYLFFGGRLKGCKQMADRVMM